MALTEEEKHSVADWLKDKFTREGRQLGAMIGYDLKSFLETQRKETVNLKVEFGGLKALLTENFSNIVVCEKASGGDDIYSVKNIFNDAKRVHTADIWKSFTHPTDGTGIYVSRGSGEIKSIRPDNIDHWCFVSKISVDDYNNISREFAESLPKEESEYYLGLIRSGEPYVQIWHQKLRDSNKIYLWESHRVEGIIRLFRQRLNEQNITLELAAYAEHQLRSSHPSKRPTSQIPNPKKTFSAGNLRPYSEFTIRTLISAFASEGEITDLKKVMLPAEFVVNLFASLRNC